MDMYEREAVDKQNHLALKMSKYIGNKRSSINWKQKTVER